MNRRTLAFAVLATSALGGCGGLSSEQTRAIRNEIAHAQAAAGAFCVAGGPGGAQATRTFTRLLREHPDVTTFDDVTVRQAAIDVASELEGCGGERYAAQLDRALRG